MTVLPRGHRSSISYRIQWDPSILLIGRRSCMRMYRHWMSCLTVPTLSATMKKFVRSMPARSVDQQQFRRRFVKENICYSASDGCTILDILRFNEQITNVATELNTRSQRVLMWTWWSAGTHMTTVPWRSCPSGCWDSQQSCYIPKPINVCLYFVKILIHSCKINCPY